MIILAADPGLTGALALLETERGNLHIVDMPVTKSARAKRGDKGVIDGPVLLEWVQTFAWSRNATHFIVEEVGGMPGQSAPNAFSFGYGCGLLRMAAICAGMAIEPVTPQRWKANMRVSTSPEQIRARASEVFPHHAHYWTPGSRVKSKDSEVGLGRAEAALLAAYGQRILRG